MKATASTDRKHNVITLPDIGRPIAFATRFSADGALHETIPLGLVTTQIVPHTDPIEPERSGYVPALLLADTAGRLAWVVSFPSELGMRLANSIRQSSAEAAHRSGLSGPGDEQ